MISFAMRQSLPVSGSLPGRLDRELTGQGTAGIVPQPCRPVKVIAAVFAGSRAAFLRRLPDGAGIERPRFGCPLVLVYNSHMCAQEEIVSPILDEHTVDFISHSPDQTRRVGARLGQLLEGGQVLCLVGDLGTGKTCLVQGIGRGMGVEDQITSPTFTLVNEYPGARFPLYHIDLYRIVDVKAAFTFGLDDYLSGDGVCVLEWAERVRKLWPEEYLLITLRHIDDTKRGLTLRGFGEGYGRLLAQLRHSAFGI
jgi:tRNA threonylcarbamoyladenosine biosynthesis protein TsaE